MVKNVFDVMKRISLYKDDWENTWNKHYSQFMINRFYSSFKDLIYIIEDISQYEVSNEQHYNYLKDNIPAKNYFKKFKMKKDEDVIIDNVKRYFQVNENIAKRYYALMDDVDYKDVVKELKKFDAYGISDDSRHI